ncbi:MAG: hypothetical protein JWM36_3266 [Hyphomicrobiales bacterium]|nr:hypothetical protein [Hyphomicrobiales bacterium]
MPDPTQPGDREIPWTNFLWPLLGALAKSLFSGWLAKRAADATSAARDVTNQDIGAAHAENETLSTIGSVEASRAALPVPADDLALARELRERAQAVRYPRPGAVPSKPDGKPSAS